MACAIRLPSGDRASVFSPPAPDVPGSVIRPVSVSAARGEGLCGIPLNGGEDMTAIRQPVEVRRIVRRRSGKCTTHFISGRTWLVGTIQGWAASAAATTAWQTASLEPSGAYRKKASARCLPCGSCKRASVRHLAAKTATTGETFPPRLAEGTPRSAAVRGQCRDIGVWHHGFGGAAGSTHRVRRRRPRLPLKCLVDATTVPRPEWIPAVRSAHA